jgi:hypothetical protein
MCLPSDMDKRRLQQRVEATARVCQILVDPSDAVSLGCFSLAPSCIRECPWELQYQRRRRSQARGERVRVMRQQDRRAEATCSTLPRRFGDIMYHVPVGCNHACEAHGLEHRGPGPHTPASAARAQRTEVGHGRRAAGQPTCPSEVFLVGL